MSVPEQEQKKLEPLTSTYNVEPWEYLERVRGAGELVWDEAVGGYLVTSYDLMKEIGRGDDDVWRTPFVPDEEHPPFGLPTDKWIAYHGSPFSLLLMEGPQHDVIHRWWMHAFSSPRVLERWPEALIRPVALDQIERFGERGRAELVADFADPVSARVIAAILGLPWEDQPFVEQLMEMTDRPLALVQKAAEQGVAPDLVDEALATTAKLRETLRPFVLARRSGEGDDFISMIWRDAEVLFGDDYRDEDVVGVAQLAFLAGAGTTSYGIANGLYLLMTQPELQEELRRGGTRAVRAFVEESLRLFGPVVFRGRRALRDTVVAGQPIKRGDAVFMLSTAGSRDPAHFECPADVRLDRPAPRDHFSFGFSGSPRTCAGQGLARLELEQIFAVVVERLRDLRLDPDAPPPVYTEVLQRRWAPLHALFTVAA
jgi:cytochrome P450